MSRKTLLTLTLLTAVVYIPFVTKGVTYDDFVFLDYAARLTKDPTRCVVADYVWQGTVLEDLVVFESTHPPLIPYWIKAITKVFGHDLVVLHIFFFPFLWLATIALADLIARTTRFSPFLAPAVTLGPLFLPIATNLMTDAALFAFWFAAMACWHRALDVARWGRLHTATCLMGIAACFTAYQGLGLVAVLAAMGLHRGRDRATMAAVSTILAPFALWLVAVWLRYDFIPYFQAPREDVSIATEVNRGMLAENMWIKGRVMLLYLGAGLGAFSAWSMVAKGRLAWWAICAGWGLALTAYLFEGGVFGINLWPWLLFTLALALVPILAALPKRWPGLPRELTALEIGLTISAAGLAVFQIAIAAFAAPRYTLITIGALFLLLLRYADGARKRPIGASIAALITVALGLAVSVADWDYARAQRVDRLDLPDDPIHFVGEKGVKYSGERLGATYFLPGMEEEVGYLLVPDEVDRIAVPRTLSEQWEEVRRYPVEAILPIRVMNRAANAGFYIHTRGLLPFTFSDERLETYRLYKVLKRGNPPWDEVAYDGNTPGPITPERPVTIETTCARDGLTRLRLLLATFRRTAHAPLEVTISELSAEGEARVVRALVIPADTLADNKFHTIDFAPITDSGGKDYRIRLAAPEATGETAITVWVNKNIADTYTAGGEQREGRPVMEMWCLSPGTRPEDE